MGLLGASAAASKAPLKPDDIDQHQHGDSEATDLATTSEFVDDHHDVNKGGDDDDVEVLPYSSVFDWTLRDPVGYYKEQERYVRLRKQYKGDDMKVSIINDMWNDRKRYHILRRFIWPPKMFMKMFYSRGYYDDYEARPTVDLKDVTEKKLPDSSERRTQEYQNARVILLQEVQADDFAAGEEREERPDNPQIITVEGESRNSVTNPEALEDFNKKSDWGDYDPKQYDRVKLEITEVPEGTNEFTLVNIYPLAKKVRLQKPHPITGKQQALLHYDTEKMAESDFYKSRNIDLNGMSLAVTPRKLGIPDDDEEEKVHKKKKNKTEHAIAPLPPAETVETVSYEVVGGGKKKKRKTKRLSHDEEDDKNKLKKAPEAEQAVETVSYEVVKKPKKKKNKKEDE